MAYLFLLVWVGLLLTCLGVAFSTPLMVAGLGLAVISYILLVTEWLDQRKDHL